MILTTSCEKDQDVVSSDLIIQNENISSFYKCAIIESELESRATLGNIFIEYSILDKNDYQQIEIKKIADKYYAVITNLIPNSSYKYQYNASNRFSSKTVKTNSIFTTLPNTSIPAVLTDTASKITKSSATVQGYVIDDGGENINEFGVVYATSSFPTIDDQKVSLTNANWDFTVTLTDLNAETNYYVRTYAINNTGVSYGNQIMFTTLKLPFENGHEYVDLGVSVKWATCNIGATVSEEAGGYYAWGETTTPKNDYEWTYYKYCLGQYYTLTKYCTDLSYAYITNVQDNKTTLDLSDDAAHVNWGGQWRMPTKSEVEELKTKCRWEWITRNGIDGYLVWGSNGNSIFLPSAGYMNERNLESYSDCGVYWTSNLSESNTIEAYALYISSSSISIGDRERCYGLSIRPVCP